LVQEFWEKEQGSARRSLPQGLGLFSLLLDVSEFVLHPWNPGMMEYWNVDLGEETLILKHLPSHSRPAVDAARE
jgi:hypothetical protein